MSADTRAISKENRLGSGACLVMEQEFNLLNVGG